MFHNTGTMILQDWSTMVLQQSFVTPAAASEVCRVLWSCRRTQSWSQSCCRPPLATTHHSSTLYTRCYLTRFSSKSAFTRATISFNHLTTKLPKKRIEMTSDAKNKRLEDTHTTNMEDSTDMRNPSQIHP